MLLDRAVSNDLEAGHNNSGVVKPVKASYSNCRLLQTQHIVEVLMRDFWWDVAAMCLLHVAAFLSKLWSTMIDCNHCEDSDGGKRCVTWEKPVIQELLGKM